MEIRIELQNSSDGVDPGEMVVVEERANDMVRFTWGFFDRFITLRREDLERIAKLFKED